MFRLIVVFVIILSEHLISGQYLAHCELSGYRVSGKKELNGMILMEAEHELRTLLMKLAEGDEGPFYRVGAVFGGSEQLVAGSLKTLMLQLIDFSNVKHNCEVDMWTRPWLTDGTELTIRCECMRTVFKHIDYS